MIRREFFEIRSAESNMNGQGWRWPKNLRPMRLYVTAGLSVRRQR